MTNSRPATSRVAVTYSWDITDAADIEHLESGKRLTVRPRLLKVHAGGWHKPGELAAEVGGRRVRQSDGELGGHKIASFTDAPRYDYQHAMSTAPEWVRELVELARLWESSR